MFYMKTITLPAGTKLYHSSSRKLSGGFPNSPNGNWFATDMFDSVVHIVRMTGRNGWGSHPMYMYVCETTKNLNLLLFENTNNARNFAMTMPNFNNSAMAGVPYYNMARFLCNQEPRKYNGWSMPNDQSQIMLCRPSEYVRFVKVMELKLPSGRPYLLHFRKSYEQRKLVNDKNRVFNYKLINVPFNKVVNSKYPPANAVYLVGRNAYYNHLGRRIENLNMEKLNRGFTINGVQKIKTGVQFTMQNKNQINTLKQRIKNAGGNVNSPWITDPYIIYVKNKSLCQRIKNKFICFGG